MPPNRSMQSDTLREPLIAAFCALTQVNRFESSGKRVPQHGQEHPRRRVRCEAQVVTISHDFGLAAVQHIGE